ncbi:unnamed protein product [Ectocarpus sp. 6 AP-2014]
MKVIVVPVLDDNFAYLLSDAAGVTAAVDPAEADKVLEVANDQGLTVSKVLTTHKHHDHAGGNNAIARRITGLEIVGGEIDRVQGATRTVKDGDTLRVGGITVKCIHTSGHTMGHICYYATEGEQKAVFTGDTLFVGGAGRFFEGTPEEMQHSLCDKLGKLPPETLVYCGHEYTSSNYLFAQSLDPENEDLKREVAIASERLRKGEHTVPSTIAKELATNPFMRAHEPSIQARTGLGEGSTTAAVLGKIRKMKNAF